MTHRIAFFVVIFTAAASAQAQPPAARSGEVVPRDVREIYDHGLKYLAETQKEDGSWPDNGQSGPGTVGMGLMVFLASGEDPNFGLYSVQVRRALRNIISAQDASTGYVGQSMYHHGFAMLALAESYGAVDDRNLWPDRKGQRTIGQALELAVRTAITSQKQNPLGAWRYSPEARDADTSVSGAVMVGLLAARNAGIEVPDEAMERAVSYYQGMTSQSGQVAYSGGMGGFDNSTARVAIATLVYSIARRRDLPEYKATLGFLKDRLENSGYDGRGYVDYTRYYQAQALFQGDVDSWEKWNKILVRQLKQSQQADGSIRGEFGGAGQHGPVDVGTGRQLPLFADLRTLIWPNQCRVCFPTRPIFWVPLAAARGRQCRCRLECEGRHWQVKAPASGTQRKNWGRPEAGRPRPPPAAESLTPAPLPKGKGRKVPSPPGRGWPKAG